MRGSVAKKGKRWYPRYYIGKDENGKWIQRWGKGCDTKSEAEKLLRRYLNEVENTYERKADNSSVEAFLQYWLRTYCEPRLAANTVRGYRVNIEKHIIPYIGNIRLNALAPRDIQKLYERLQEKGLSNTSIRYVHNNLHKALSYAVKQEVIFRNPADLVDAPVVDRYDADTLSPDAVKRLLSVCASSEIYVPVALAVTLGLRRGEALGLSWNDVDFANDTVTIRHSASFCNSGITLHDTKTKSSRRTLTLPAFTRCVLEDALIKQQSAISQYGSAYNTLQLVCCRSDGKPLTSCCLHHAYKTALHDAGLPSIRFHDLRHSYATLMLRSAVPAKIVSSILGHSSIGITLDTYSHVAPDMQAVAVDAIDGILDADKRKHK